MTKKIITLLHAEFEQPGYISQWAEQNDFEIEPINCWENPVYPDPKEVDRLLIMGGPMSVYEALKYLWMLDEIRFIRSVIDAGKKVLGICLGSQMISAALEAKVYPNHSREIGWFEIKWDKAAYEHPLTYGVSSHSKVFHYHGDTFDLPKNAVLLASSNGCQNQAFAFGNNVLALQFHMEVTHELLEDMLDHEDELIPEKFVQSKKRIQDAFMM